MDRGSFSSCGPNGHVFILMALIENSFQPAAANVGPPPRWTDGGDRFCDPSPGHEQYPGVGAILRAGHQVVHSAGDWCVNRSHLPTDPSTAWISLLTSLAAWPTSTTSTASRIDAHHQMRTDSFTTHFESASPSATRTTASARAADAVGMVGGHQHARPNPRAVSPSYGLACQTVGMEAGSASGRPSVPIR